MRHRSSKQCVCPAISLLLLLSISCFHLLYLLTPLSPLPCLIYPSSFLSPLYLSSIPPSLLSPLFILCLSLPPLYLPLYLSPLLSLLQSYVAAGSGEPGGDVYHSFVLYHNNSPRWAEQIKLPIPVDMFRGAHVRFEFRHCSSKILLHHSNITIYMFCIMRLITSQS